MTITLTSDDFKRAVDLCGLKTTRSSTSSGGFYECPQHTDKTPSLRVSFNKGIFHCFSCHYSGTINKLCKDQIGRSIYQVLGYSSDFSLESDDKHIVRIPYVEEKVDESKVNLDIQGVLVPVETSYEGKNYLKSRGISLEVAKRFGMKYAENVYINRTYFTKRIMTPIYGVTGKLINYEGRDITRQAKAKVLYPKNAIKPLFDFNNLDTSKPLFLVEGLIDLFLLKEDAYFSNVSAMLGSALSPYQLEFVRKFGGVILIPNNDTAGASSVDLVNRAISTEPSEGTSGKMNLSILRITDPHIKDVGEIPEKLGMSVKQYREEGRFALKPYNSFLL